MSYRSRTEGNLTTTVRTSPRIVAPLVALYALITVLTFNDATTRLLTEPFRAIGTLLLALVMLYGLYRLARVLVRHAGRDLRALWS